jgi:hypothetical protein
MHDAVLRALDLTPSSIATRTVDITTTGRRSGGPRRIETWVYATGGRLYLTGPPGRRGWVANLLAEPSLVLHLPADGLGDVPATARPVTDPGERRQVLTPLVAAVSRDGGAPATVERWVAASPLLEVRVG